MALVLVLGFLSVGPAAAETATFMASKDAFVWNEVPDTNIGGHSVSEVGREGAKNAPVGLKRGLLQFGISTLPSEAIITGVTLRLFVNGNTAQEPLNLNLTVARLSADFVEGDGTSGVTWNTQPGVETSPIDIATMNSQVGDWFEMDVTAVTVVEWESGDPTNVLIRVAPTDESTVEGRWFNYRTKENGAGNDRAQLEIDYVLPTSTPTNTSTATPTSTPTPTPTFTPTQTPTNTPTPAPIGGCCAFAGVNGLSATCVDELAPEWQLPVVSIDVCLAIRNTLLDGDQILYLNRDTVCDPPGSLPGTCPTPDATPPDPVADPIVSDLVPGEGIRISGGAGSAVPGGTVWVSNPSTGEYVGANVAPDGSFTAPPIHAAMDDVLHIRVLDSTFNTSSVVQVIVGPPDPSALESPIVRWPASRTDGSEPGRHRAQASRRHPRPGNQP
jgi:hypothetical protein